MKVQLHLITVNLLLICAVAALYFLGYPLIVIAACGAFFFLLANFILISRMSKSKDQKTSI